MKKVIQILNVLLLLVAAGGVFYLAAVLKNGNDSKIELISFEGNSHLTKEQYLSGQGAVCRWSNKFFRP